MNANLNSALVDAYKFNRYQALGNVYPRKGPNPAREALRKAREDVAAGRTRYPAGIYPAVTWQPGKPGLAFVENVERAGLRHVGNVEAQPGGRNGFWSTRETCGWYTDPHGDVFKDGSGLCWGVVYQLPGRNGKARFVAGYVMGGCSDDMPLLDLARIFEEDCRNGDSWNTDPKEFDAAREAARAADSMAQEAAEEEREYQTAWQAGSLYASTREELATIRARVLTTIRDLKGACATLRTLPESLKARIKESIESELEEREELHSKLAKLASGDFDSLIFYPSERLRQAFNEGASENVL